MKASFFARRFSRSGFLRPRWIPALRAITIASSLLAITLSVQAQTYLIDFGGPNTTAHDVGPFDDPNNFWNDVDNTLGGTSNGVLANLVTTLNSTSSVSLVIVSRFNGNNENGTQGSSLYPIDATRDSLYGNTEIWNDLTNIFPSFKLTGLDPATKYSFSFYASRTGVSDNRETGYTVTGGNSGFAALDPVENVDNTVSVADITPDGAGEIRIDLAPTANNNNGFHFTYLGVLRVDAVPPQTPLAFTKQPSSQRVIQLKPATFTCEVSGPPPYFVTWFENGNPIPDAHQFSYTIPSADLSMNGYQYSVTVSNLAYGVTSTNAMLSVLSDTNPPLALTAASYDGATVLVTFNEPMDFSASDPSHYVVNGGAVEVWAGQLSADNLSVTLTLSAPIAGNFAVVINQVSDIAGNPIAPNTSVSGKVVAIEDQDLLIDFGGNTMTQFGPAPDDPNNYWNNVPAGIGGSDVGEIQGLVTSHNATTPIGFVIIRRFNGANENGTTLSTVFPGNATRDSLFGNTEFFGAGSNFFPSFKLTGLNPARQYSFTIYASRGGVGDNRETGYTIEGANSGFTTLNPANNVNNTTKVEGITPNSSGEISVSIAPTPKNNNASHFTYLGILKLSPYVAPLKFLTPILQNGKIRLEWTGSGQLLRASSLNGSWNPVTPAPSSPYEEDLIPGQNRYYRLQQ